jgi:hypothetical protein
MLMPWGDIASSTPHTSDSESLLGGQFGLPVSQMPVKWDAGRRVFQNPLGERRSTFHDF